MDALPDRLVEDRGREVLVRGDEEVLVERLVTDLDLRHRAERTPDPRRDALAADAEWLVEPEDVDDDMRIRVMGLARLTLI